MRQPPHHIQSPEEQEQLILQFSLLFIISSNWERAAMEKYCSAKILQCKNTAVQKYCSAKILQWRNGGNPSAVVFSMGSASTIHGFRQK